MYGSDPFGTDPSDPPSSVLYEIDAIVANHTTPGSPIIDGDGSVGDPASLGAAVLLASQFRPDNASLYLDAASDELNVLYAAPEYSNGAISHRAAPQTVSLWSDSTVR